MKNAFILIIILLGFLFIMTAVRDSLRARVLAKEYAAKGNVITISTALDAYAKANNGKYPVSESALVDGNVPYLSKSYNNQVIHGYRYLLELNTDSYRVVAKPETCGATGTVVITVVTGGEMQEEGCK